MPEFIDNLKAECANRRIPPDYAKCSELIRKLLQILNSAEKGKIKIVGQPEMNKRLVSAFILNEHVLLEGLPGVAKTTAVNNLANEAAQFFNRIQFIPDMQPSDLIGKRDLKPVGGSFLPEWKDGPLFANLVLADEINRAPSRVQAALLEAMGEKQITPFGMDKKIIWHENAKAYLENHPPPEIFKRNGRINVDSKASTQFSVFATMNPIEIEGTYPLSEAQVDRFCFKTIVYFPDYDNLLRISDKVFQRQDEENASLRSENVSSRQGSGSNMPTPEDFLLSLYFIQHCRQQIFERDDKGFYRHIEQKMIEKMARIVYFSNYKYDDDPETHMNDPEQLGLQMNLRQEKHALAQKLPTDTNFRYIESGSSPRGLESLLKASLCEAFINGDETVKAKHIREAAYDVLRHRIRLKIQAKTQNIASVDIIEILLNTFLDEP